MTKYILDFSFKVYLKPGYGKVPTIQLCWFGRFMHSKLRAKIDRYIVQEILKLELCQVKRTEVDHLLDSKVLEGKGHFSCRTFFCFMFEPRILLCEDVKVVPSMPKCISGVQVECGSSV